MLNKKLLPPVWKLRVTNNLSLVGLVAVSLQEVRVYSEQRVQDKGQCSCMRAGSLCRGQAASLQYDTAVLNLLEFRPLASETEACALPQLGRAAVPVTLSVNCQLSAHHHNAASCCLFACKFVLPESRVRYWIERPNLPIIIPHMSMNRTHLNSNTGSL